LLEGGWLEIREGLHFVAAEDIVFFPARAFRATEAAGEQDANSGGDHQGEEASACDEPVNKAVHIAQLRATGPIKLDAELFANGHPAGSTQIIFEIRRSLPLLKFAV
jgi:hypothetical protein